MLGWVLLAGAAPPLDAAPARPQPLSDIVAVVEDACRREAGHRGYDTVSVTVRSLDRRLNLPQCSQALVSFPVQAQQVLGALSMGVRCGGAQPWTIYVRADVQARRMIPVLTGPLPGRSLITADDIELVPVSADAVLHGVVLEPQQIIGRELTRSLDAGSPLKVSQLRLPKLVRRGNLVTLVSGGAGLEVRMQGKVLGDGAAGDVVKVANLSSGQVVEGVVNPDGSITVY